MKEKTIVYANNKNIIKLSAKKDVLFLGVVFLQDKANSRGKDHILKTEVNLYCSKKKVSLNNIYFYAPSLLVMFSFCNVRSL